MDCFKAVHDYVTRMVDSCSGMKVLLLDEETTGIVSVAYSQSAMLQKEVFLFEQMSRLEAKAQREVMPHLRAVVFLRPTQDNLDLLVAELREPKYGEYFIFFSNVVSDRDIERLAEADEQEVVKDVQEMYADYYALSSYLFTLNRPSVMHRSPSAHQAMLSRTTDGLCALLLSLKKSPQQIRFSGNSKLAKELAAEVKYRIGQDPSLFDFPVRGNAGGGAGGAGGAPLLLILDRADDPVTPLLMQWTYRAMVHELIGISNNRVLLPKEKRKNDQPELILSTTQDSFYRDNINKNFGELGISIKVLVEEFQKKTNNNKNIGTLEDIRRFLQDFPEFRKLSANVSKHVALMTELSQTVERRHLMETSAREQELACKDAHAAHLKLMEEVAEAPGIQPLDKVRLAMLYALRYEDHKQEDVKRVIRLLADGGVSAEDVSLVAAVIAYAGKKSRTGELFSSVWGKEGLSLDKIRKFASEAIKGVDNIYTQHKPLLFEIISDVLNSKLRTDYYPYLVGQPSRDPPKHLIVFFVGGTTYEEALVVSEFNAAGPDGKSYSNPSKTKIVLGGTHVHNSSSFLDELRLVSI
jgi:vacuolar protein sorting-associated protein 45